MWNNSKKIMGVQSLALLALILSVMVLAGCSDDDDITIEQPSSQGVFIDERDGKEYHYIHIGGLDWSVENLAYDLGNTELSCVYQSASDFEKQKYTLDNLEKYGMLYSYEGAQQAVPEGWRLPTDADWKKLEAAHGYLCKPLDCSMEVTSPRILLQQLITAIVLWVHGHTFGQRLKTRIKWESIILLERSSTITKRWSA